MNEKELWQDLSQNYAVTSDISVKEHLKSELETEKNKLRKYLKTENPLRDNQLALIHSEKELKKQMVTIELLENDFKNFKALANDTKSRIDEKFWLSEIQKLKFIPEIQALSKKFNSNVSQNSKKKSKIDHEQKIICRTLLLQQWRKLLDEQFLKWEINKIQEFRRNIWNKLKEWLKNLQLLTDALDNLSIEPGLLFDLSKGDMSLSSLKKVKRWAEYISKDKGVKELCDMIGRLRSAEITMRQELVKRIRTVTEPVPDIHSMEEIIGIHLWRDIEHALPQEIALLSDDEIAILFDMKFVEYRLMCFEMEGMQINSYDVEDEFMVEHKEEEQLGPIIICIDTSGSMQGSPETIAKAITLFMATRAISQKRNCLLINFSTSIEVSDLSGKMGMSKLIEFLQRSFHGGTDVSPALTYALQMMHEKKYNKSDLLIISDFIMNSLPELLHEKILEAKANENKFYSLSIGDLFLSQKLKSIFDNEWVFNPNNSSIHSLLTMVKSIKN